MNCKNCGTLLLSQFIINEFITDKKEPKSIIFKKKKPFKKEKAMLQNIFFSLQNATINLKNKSQNQQEYRPQGA